MTLSLHDIRYVVKGRTWLSDINLTLEPGSLYVLLGATDAGKTTLLRLLAGLDRPTGGVIREHGEDITNRPVSKREIAFVYQQFVNYPSFTVYDNIAAPLRRRRLAPGDIDQQVRSVAGSLHIEHLLDRLPANLSGGQQQRVAIARGLVKRARHVLLDEPLVNLDYQLRQELREELRSIFRDDEQIVVYATTEPDEALQLGGTTIVLHQGRILQTGPAAEVHARPASVEVARIFSDPPMNIAPAQLNGETLRLGARDVTLPGHLKGLVSGPCEIGIRPHRITMTPRDGALTLDGRLALAEVDGAHTFSHLEMDGAEWVIQRDGVHPFPPGTPMRGYAHPDDFYLFDKAGTLVGAPSPDTGEGP
jgi:glycerol transport system ATP-binding protein